MVTTVLTFVAGLALLVGGAEVLVRGASRLALTLGISPLVVGLTVVAFGTSSPELAVSVQSAWSGKADLAVGNVVGSNIFNVLFILGASALIVPLLVARQLVRQEVPIMIGATLLLLLLGLDGRIGTPDGLLLLALLVGYTAFIIAQSRRQNARGADVDLEEVADTTWDRQWHVQVLLVIVGLVLLVAGSNWLVGAAVEFATVFGISEQVIGLTILAAGTSLPEVATSIMAAIRGQRDIAVGNVVGSNIFNILGVLGLSGLVAGGGLSVAPAMIAFDIPIMLAVAVGCLPIFFTGNLIARWEGALFLGLYVAYTTYLILAAQQHDTLEPFSAVVGWGVLPLVAVTLVVVGWREWRSRGT